jgi:SAM-dependent methyltransferase
MAQGEACRACGARDIEVFHEQRGIPVNSCLLVADEEAARTFPTGDLVLGWCPSCGFIQNLAFDERLISYTDQYEETQGFSPRFRAFARDLADHWIDRHDIRDREILEIGCGKGEFLAELCERGANRGIGVDPSYVEGRLGDAADRLSFITDFWSDRYADQARDVVISRHTLEHIPAVGAFMESVGRAVADRPGALVLFEVPDVLRVLEEPAFWDLYYEHCSYFSPGSLARLFRRTGFDVTDLWLAFDDQYIILDATSGPTRDDVGSGAADRATAAIEDDMARMADAVHRFPERFAAMSGRLRSAVEDAGDRGPAVLWGAGSKAVSFLTTLGIDGQISAAVDVNPHKQDRYLAGTGHHVVAPEALVDDPPATVFVMNGIYREEIGRQLESLSLHPELVAL